MSDLSTPNKSLRITAALLGLLVVSTAVWLWWPRGYGEVSPRAYEMATALYGACLARSESRLTRVDTLLRKERADGALSEQERRWLGDMIQTAQEGDWMDAALAARRVLEDQVKR